MSVNMEGVSFRKTKANKVAPTGSPRRLMEITGA
jgi:hypothetical protein